MWCRGSYRAKGADEKLGGPIVSLNTNYDRAQRPSRRPSTALPANMVEREPSSSASPPAAALTRLVCLIKRPSTKLTPAAVDTHVWRPMKAVSSPPEDEPCGLVQHRC